MRILFSDSLSVTLEKIVVKRLFHKDLHVIVLTHDNSGNICMTNNPCSYVERFPLHIKNFPGKTEALRNFPPTLVSLQRLGEFASVN